MNNNFNNEKNSLLMSYQNPEYEIDANENIRERSRTSSSGDIMERDGSLNIKNNNRKRKSNYKKEESQFPLGSLKIIQNIILQEEKLYNIQTVNSFSNRIVSVGSNIDINNDIESNQNNLNNKTEELENTTEIDISNLRLSPTTLLLNESSRGSIENAYLDAEARKSRSNSINKYSYTSHTLTLLSSIPDMINQHVPSINHHSNNSYEEIIDEQSNQNQNMENFMFKKSTLTFLFIILFLLILIGTTTCICIFLHHFLNIDITWMLVLAVVMIMFIIFVIIVSYSSLRYQLSTYVVKPLLPFHSSTGRIPSSQFNPLKRQGSFSRIP